MYKESLLRSNIERAIQRTFNIRKLHDFGPAGIVGQGVEISGAAVASQEAQELNSLLLELAMDLAEPYHFPPNGKWSVLNMNKIKVQWANRCQQTVDSSGKVWNIIPGSWIGDVFSPDLLSRSVRVEIHPSAPPPSQKSSCILIPHHIYHIQSDINDLVPQVRFGKKQLECVNPKSIASISINRQGIYVNRKYRDKMELVRPADPLTYIKVDQYRLDIYYNDRILDSYDLGARSQEP
jgi:hypothetical protein